MLYDELVGGNPFGFVTTAFQPFPGYSPVPFHPPVPPAAQETLETPASEVDAFCPLIFGDPSLLSDQAPPPHAANRRVEPEDTNDPPPPPPHQFAELRVSLSIHFCPTTMLIFIHLVREKSPLMEAQYPAVALHHAAPLAPTARIL